MRNWYLYYRLLHAVMDGGPTLWARLELQDVLCDLRSKARCEYPEATDQDIQDWYEHLARNPNVLSEAQVRRLTRMESWATGEAIDV